MDMKDKASQGMEGMKKEARVLQGEESKDKKYATSRKFDDEDAARFEFSQGRQRLFNVNAWSNIPGILNSGFELFGRDGKPLQRDEVQNGDFIKIDLPGPFPFYWVRVVEITNEPDRAQFTVQPTYDPTHNDDKTETDHFFQDQARSIFRIERNGNEITAMEVGVNESINNQEVEAGKKGLINTLVSEGGWAGFQRYQWKNLTDYLVGIRPPK